MERANGFVRFHAWQAILGLGGLGLLSAGALCFPFLTLLLSPFAFTLMYRLSEIFAIVWVVAWIVCLIKAMSGVRWHMPVAGRYAERLATETLKTSTLIAAKKATEEHEKHSKKTDRCQSGINDLCSSVFSVALFLCFLWLLIPVFRRALLELLHALEVHLPPACENWYWLTAMSALQGDFIVSSMTSPGMNGFRHASMSPVDDRSGLVVPVLVHLQQRYRPALTGS